MKREKKVSALLAVDIGNTAVHLGFFRGGRMAKVCQFDTKSSSAELFKNIKGVFADSKYREIDAIVICSVVPRMTRILEPFFKKEFCKNTYLSGRDIIVPLKNRYLNPAQVGQDRLVGAYAAVQSYHPPLIVVDLGTAITLDVVSKQNEYLGGIIVPGLKLSAEALYQQTALLPLVKIGKPRTIIGRDTQGSILSGIFYGYGAMINGLVAMLKDRISADAKVIMTGGFAGLMKEFFRKDVTVDDNLVLKGLYLLHAVTKVDV